MKETKALFSGNNKPLEREIEENIKKIDLLCSWIG
jgi:hypothetical protein